MNMLKKVIMLALCMVTQAASGMFYAILQDDSAKVEKLLAQGYKVDKKDKYSKTALMLAAYHDKKDIVKILLKHGAKVDETDKDGHTALVWAARSGNDKIVNILILFANKEDLKVLLAEYDTELSRVMQDFIVWIANNSPRKDLEKNAVRFARLAFAMPHFVAEFEMLFKLLGKDYAKLFTADVIERALLTQNIKAFEILIDKARKDNNSNLLKLISVEVEKFPKTNFNQKFFAQLKVLLSGKKVSGVEKLKDVYVGFE